MQLREIGYNHLTLPVLALEDLLSRDLLHNDSLRFLVHARAVEVCLELNLTNGYTFHEKICGPVNISEIDQAKYVIIFVWETIPKTLYFVVCYF